MKARVSWVVACALALVALPATLTAQDVDDLRTQYLLEDPTDYFVENAARAQPGSSSGSPTAFGADWGDVFIGAGYQQQARYTDEDDGTVVMGFGLGNRSRYVGLEVALTSVSTINSGFFDRTTMSFKLHRLMTPNLGVAVGYENAIIFEDGTDGGSSVYGAMTYTTGDAEWHPFRNVTGTIGLGNGRFRFEEDVITDEENVNAFASLGVQVAEPLSVIADWTGQDLTVALSIVPFRRFPLVITPGMADLTGSAGDEPRFILGVGLGYQLPWAR